MATVRIMLPEGGDADLEALMKTWRDTQALRSAQGFDVVGTVAICRGEIHRNIH